MSLMHDAARQYLAEHYDNVLNEDGDMEYAVLSDDGRRAFDSFVDQQADRLAAHLRNAVESFMVDADTLPEEARS